MFSVTVGNILSYGLGNLLGYMFLSLFTQHKDTTMLPRDMSNSGVCIYIYIYIYMVIHNGLKVLV